MVAPEKYRSGGGLGDYYERPTHRWDPGTTITPTRGKVRAGAVQEHIKINTEYNIIHCLKNRGKYPICTYQTWSEKGK